MSNIKRKQGVIEKKTRRLAAERGYRVRRASGGLITVTDPNGRRYRTYHWPLALDFVQGKLSHLRGDGDGHSHRRGG